MMDVVEFLPDINYAPFSKTTKPLMPTQEMHENDLIREVAGKQWHLNVPWRQN